MTEEDRAILLRVDRAFAAMQAASAKLHRSRRPESIEKAREAYNAAEKEYRKLADERDVHFEIRTAQETQRRGRRANGD